MNGIRKAFFALTVVAIAVGVVACDRSPAAVSSPLYHPLGPLFNTGVPDATECGESVS